MVSRSVEGGASDVVQEEDNTKPPKVKTTPLPKLKIFACSSVFLSEAMCSCVLLPFVGLYVAHLQGISVESAGYFSGVLVGLFMLGQVLSSKVWGWVSDMYGRKVPLNTGLCAGAIASFFFGISPNIYICCLMRFLHGVFNGNVLIAKIIVSDVTDATNAPMGFSTIGLLWCVGAVVGPAIGGLLYDPLENPQLQWLHVHSGSFLARYPAFLPCTFLSLYTMCTFVLCMVVLPETNKNRTKSLRRVPIIGWMINWVRPKRVTIVDDIENFTEQRSGSEWRKGDRPLSSKEPHASTTGACSPASPAVPPMTYKRALKDPVIRAITILYMCVSAADMVFNEVLPLWAISSIAKGGLGMFSDEVGILMLLFSVPTFFANLFFARVYKAVHNPSRMFAVCAVVNVLCIIFIAFGSNFSGWVSFAYVLVLGSGKNCTGSVLYNIIHLHTAKASPPGTVGSVYGISQSFSFSVRAVVPFLAAPSYAWSVSSDHPFPFNRYFTFIVFSLPLVYGVYVALTRRLERTKEEVLEWTQEAKPEQGEEGEEEGLTRVNLSWRTGEEAIDGEGNREGGVLPHGRSSSSTGTPSTTRLSSGISTPHHARRDLSDEMESQGRSHSWVVTPPPPPTLPEENFSSRLDFRSLAGSFAMSTGDVAQLMDPSDPYFQYRKKQGSGEWSVGQEDDSDEDEEDDDRSSSASSRAGRSTGSSGGRRGGRRRRRGSFSLRRPHTFSSTATRRNNNFPKTPTSRFLPQQEEWVAKHTAQLQQEDPRCAQDSEEEA